MTTDIHINGQAAIVGPDDHLVISFPQSVSMADLDYWNETIKAGVPGPALARRATDGLRRPAQLIYLCRLGHDPR